MNRAERRQFKKKLGKQLGPKAEKIIALHNEYEGKDDAKLEKLVMEETKDLNFGQLMLLMEYLENTIGAK
jgi:hypothetical protein